MRHASGPRSRATLAHLAGARIRTLRLERGWSEEHLATLLRLPSLIRGYEEGRRLPRTYTLYQLSNVFGIGVGSFLGEPEPTSDPHLARLAVRLSRLDSGSRGAVLEFLQAFTSGLERLSVAMEREQDSAL
jgi:transcriptional regulator with XRE-family HTH domain